MARKGFRITENELQLYEELKEKENFKSDSEFFIKMLHYSERFLNNRVIDVELLEQKEKENKTLILKVGELQGRLAELQTRIEELQAEINIYKQQAFPKKKPWYKFW